MKLSIRQRILNYYKRRKGEWIASGEIQRLVAEKTDKTPQNAGRRLRELAEDGLLEVEIRKKHAWYRFKEQAPQIKRVMHIEVINGRAIQSYQEVAV